MIRKLRQIPFYTWILTLLGIHFAMVPVWLAYWDTRPECDRAQYEYFFQMPEYCAQFKGVVGFWEGALVYIAVSKLLGSDL